MANEIATLGIEVQTRGVQQAARDLDRVKNAGKQAESSTRSFSSSLTSMRGAIAAAGIAIGIAQIVSLSRSMVEAQAQTDKLRSSLGATFGQARVGQEIQYVREVTERLGLAFGSTASAYAKFAAAANGTALTGAQVRQIFESISAASTTFGLSQQEAEGALLAVSQMMSKGVVSAEELRGQLGERLPGAFNIAARAMGKTTAELGKMLETGQILAADFLPRFASELQRSLGDAPERAATQTQAAINRLSSAWDEAKRAFADSGGASVVTGVLNTIAAAAREAAAAMREAKAAGLGGFTSAAVGLAGGAAGAVGATPFTGTTEARKKELMVEVSRLTDEVRKLETKAYRTPFERQDLQQYTRELQVAKTELDRLATTGSFTLPNLKGQFAEQQQANLNAINAFINERKSLKERMGADIEAEKVLFKAATSGFKVGSKEYETALESHNRKLAEIREKYDKKAPAVPKAAKVDLNLGQDVAAADAYANAIDAIQSANVTASRSTLDLNTAQATLFDLMSSSEWDRMPETWRQLVIEQAASATATIDTANAQKQLNALIAQTPTAQLEAQRATMQLLAKAFEDGKISAEQFSEAATTALGNKIPDSNKEAADSFKTLKDAIEGWGKDSAKAIVDFALTGKSSFSDMVNSMLADLARMVIQQQITGKLAQTVGAFFSSGSTPVANAKGGVYDSPSLSAYSSGVYHSPRMFAFAQGAGIFAEAGPEAIMPLSRDASGRLGVKAEGAGTNVNIEIINNTGAAVQQREAADSRGGRKMQIVIGEAVSGEMRRPGSSLNAATRQTFGLTPVLAGR